MILARGMLEYTECFRANTSANAGLAPPAELDRAYTIMESHGYEYPECLLKPFLPHIHETLTWLITTH